MNPINVIGGQTVSINGAVPGLLSSVLTELPTPDLAPIETIRKLRSPMDISQSPFSAAADGNAADNTTQIDAVIATGRPGYVPFGIFPTTISAYDAVGGRFWGEGQLKDANGAGCKWPYERTAILEPPASQCHEDAQQTAFTGDDSKVAGPIGNPAGVYWGPDSTGLVIETNAQYPELCPRRLVATSNAGFNGTILGGGRSQLNMMRHVGFNYGKGDFALYNGIGIVNGDNPASPASFLECPAISLLNGSLASFGDGRYLNSIEIEHNDGGFDVAAIGMVLRFNRTNSTGALGTVHMGTLVRSNASDSMDAFHSAGGKSRIGLDFSFATFDPAGTWIKAAIVLKADDRIYGNASGTSVGSYGLMPDAIGDAWFKFGSGAWQWVISGGTVMSLSSGNLALPAGCLAIKSAQATPGGVAGLVTVYMDTSDGKLKYQLPDSTVRTITYT